MHGEVIEAALAEDKWEEVGTLNVTPTSVRRPAAIYKVAEGKIALYGSSYRAIVVHSSNHDKRRQKRIDRQLGEARGKAEKAVKQAEREVFSCEKDAQAALEKLEKTFAKGLWQAGGSLKSREVRASGKVAIGNERKVVRTEFRLSLGILENQELTERFRAQAGCFVLLSNAPAPAPEITTEVTPEIITEVTQEIKSKVTTKEVTGIKAEAEQIRPGQRLWSAPQCLQAYKEQHGVESNFSFLKEPLIVNDVFLKNPGRIDALGMVMLLSLLLWSLMQRSLRQSVEQQPELRLSDLDNKPTKRPTSFIMVHKFLSVIILKIGGHRRLSKPLRSDQLQYLRALGLDHTVFTTPPRKHMKPVPT